MFWVIKDEKTKEKATYVLHRIITGCTVPLSDNSPRAIITLPGRLSLKGTVQPVIILLIIHDHLNTFIHEK